MTAPRMPLFQRKGGDAPPSGAPSGKPSVVIAIGHGGATPKGQPSDDGGPNAGQGDGDQGPVQCPNCGCRFDPATGEVMNQDGYQKPDDSAPADGGDASDVGSKLKAMMGGG